MKKLYFLAILLGFSLSGNAQLQEVISGDFDGDGKITHEDITHLADVALGKEEPTILFVDPYNGHEYVDLGLSVKWATCNVGTNSPEQAGYYIAWGETAPQKNNIYSWYNSSCRYKWCTNGYNTLTKYNSDSSYGIVDNKKTLEPADDAASVNWGGVWRMPTSTELNELKNSCTWTWTSKNGKNGYEVKGKNGNSIFLPAAGYGSSGSIQDNNTTCNYWSSSYSFSYYASYLMGKSSQKMISNLDRCNGASIRAVAPKE